MNIHTHAEVMKVSCKTYSEILNNTTLIHTPNPRTLLLSLTDIHLNTPPYLNLLSFPLLVTTAFYAFLKKIVLSYVRWGFFRAFKKYILCILLGFAFSHVLFLYTHVAYSCSSFIFTNVQNSVVGIHHCISILQ